MNYQFHVGIDVSKSTLDMALINVQCPDEIHHIKTTNDDEGISYMLEWLKGRSPDFSIGKSIFCMEATGLYCYPLLQFLYRNEAFIWVENAVQIKNTAGIIRGKNDKIDAIRIAQYAVKYGEKVRLWKPTREVVDKLKHLAVLRERLVETRKRLLVPIEEFRQVGNNAMANLLQKAIDKSIAALEDDIAGIEMQMKKLIDDDDQLKKLFALISSVIGIGFVTAVNMIVYTNEFKIMKDAKKLACYCGVAPFGESSGTSIKKRTKVSHMANKKLKTNLHMAALSSIRHDKGMKSYYERKVAEGKPKLMVLNAVRNKLIGRIIAVVKRQTLYTEIYSPGKLAVS